MYNDLELPCADTTFGTITGQQLDQPSCRTYTDRTLMSFNKNTLHKSAATIALETLSMLKHTDVAQIYIYTKLITAIYSEYKVVQHQ